MASRNRETLRNFFSDGKLPSENHFGDLIDSTLNMKDEGFRKSAANGVEISAPVGHDALISFYRDRNPNTPKSSIAFGRESDRHEQLLFKIGSADSAPGTVPVLTLDAVKPVGGDELESAVGAGQRVGINTQNPETELDVCGVIRAEGRVGGYAPAGIEAATADGAWHDVTPALRGCQAFEVMAGVGLEGSSRFALLHAIAVNTFNPPGRLFDFLFPRKTIRHTSAYYNRRCDQLEVRWNGGSGRDADFTLQIRSRCFYGQDVKIKCHLTRLWFDPTMRR